MHLGLRFFVFIGIFSIYDQLRIIQKPTSNNQKKVELKSSIDNKILKNILDDISLEKQDENEFQFPKQVLYQKHVENPLLSKRSNIETPSFSNDEKEEDGALVVIDVSGPSNEVNADKKSSISDTVTKSEIYDGKGYSIVLNNNGDASEEKVGQKDEIYYQMQAAYRDMEKEFSGIVREPRDPKKVHVIVITPKVGTEITKSRDDAEKAVARDKLPEAIVNNSTIEKNKVNQSSSHQVNLSKSDLEIDIDKLRHVKEKLKLLNEDYDKVSDGISEDNTNKLSYKKDSKNIPNESEVQKYREQGANEETAKLDNNAIGEVERQLHTLNSYSKLTNSDDVVKDSANQIYNIKKLQRKNETFQSHVREPTVRLKSRLAAVMNKNHRDITIHEHLYEHEIDSRSRKNDSDSVFYEPTSTSTTSTTTTKHFIDKITNDNEKESHQIYGTRHDKNELSENALLSKDKLELEKDIAEQRSTSRLPKNGTTATTTTTSSTTTTTATSNPKSHEIHEQGKADNNDNRKHEIAKYVQKLLLDDEKNKRNMSRYLKVSDNINKTVYENGKSSLLGDESFGKQATVSMLKAIIKMKNEERAESSLKENYNKTSTEAETQLSTEPPSNAQLRHLHEKKETQVISVSDNPHEIKTLHKVTDKPNPEVEVNKVPTPRGFHEDRETTSKASRTINKRKAEAIIEFLNKDPLESWKYEFATLRSLDLNSTILRSGLVNAGNIERLKGVMKRALQGKDITLSVVGGSISAGGGLYKDKGNIDGLYYKGVVDWWNKMISPLTGSQMKINNIAIGSIGTDYFSYCIKNHISEKTDIVLWELSANDFNRYKMQPTKGARPLERLTRMILELPSQPALLYVNFFKGVDYKASRESCPNFEDQGEDIIAHYYKIPSLSWRAMVCGGLVRQENGFKIEALFSQDQYHPSLRGHAQMSLLLLLHLRHVMRAVLQSAIAHDGYIENFEELYALPEPLFLGPKSPEPLCWTLITADMSEQITNTLSVRVNDDEGFKLEYATNFPIRFDKVICWKAEKPNAQVALQFYIPENYGRTGLKRLRSEVAITTHTRWGGSATLWIDDMKEKAIVIKEGRPNDPGKRTQVDSIANDIPAGSHTLNIKSRDKGFCLSSIMIDGS